MRRSASRCSSRRGSQIEKVRSGTYQIIVDNRFTTEIEVCSPVELDIKVHDLVVKLENAEAPRYVQAVIVRSEPFGTLDYQKPPPLFRVRDGMWRNDDLLEGRYEIEVSAPGFHTERRAVLLEESSTSTVRLEPRSLAEPIPEKEVENLERSILELVLADVRRRIEDAYTARDGELPIHLLARTDALALDRIGTWMVEDQEVDMEEILRPFEHGSRTAPIEIASLAKASGLVPVRLADVPIVRHRIGEVDTALELIDEGRYEEWLDPPHVVLAITRPQLDRGGRRAFVLVTSKFHDPFHWIYMVNIDGDKLTIEWVAEPVLGC